MPRLRPPPSVLGAMFKGKKTDFGATCCPLSASTAFSAWMNPLEMTAYNFQAGADWKRGYINIFFDPCVLELNLGSFSIILYSLAPLSIKWVLGKAEVFSQWSGIIIFFPSKQHQIFWLQKFWNFRPLLRISLNDTRNFSRWSLKKKIVCPIFPSIPKLCGITKFY